MSEGGPLTLEDSSQYGQFDEYITLADTTLVIVLLLLHQHPYKDQPHELVHVA